MKSCVNCKSRFYEGEGHKDMCSKDCYDEYWSGVEKLFAGESASDE